MFHIFYFSLINNMSRYEKFIVYPGPEYKKYSSAIQRSDVTMGNPFYLIKYTNTYHLDNCRYVVKINTMGGKAPLLNWRIDVDLKYIQLYWSKGLHMGRMENNKHVMIIRPKYRVIFRCIARLIQLKKRAQVRVKTRQSFRVSGLFKRHVFAPASMRVFAYI